MTTAVVFTLVLVLGVGWFARTAYRRFLVLAVAAPDDRFQRWTDRIRLVVEYAFGQLKFLRDERERGAGIMHAVIFWGFVVLLLQIVTMFGRAYSAEFSLPGLRADQLGGPYLLLRDIMEVSVSLAVLYALCRWILIHPARLRGYEPAEERLRGQSHWEAYLILVFILVIMSSGLLYDGGRFVFEEPKPLLARERAWAPVSAAVGVLLGGLGKGGAELVSDLAWWIHNLVVLAFLNLLPRSKHFHIITFLPNVLFAKLEPRGALSKMDLENATRFGTSHINHFTWKQILDMYSCTECGRCSSHCPATASGKPLAPRQLLLNLRDHLYAHEDELVARRGRATNGENPVGETVISEKVVSDEVIWSCTTCRACEEACPILIEYVDKIVDMRRYLVQEEARFPAELTRTFKGMETHSNPWGMGNDKRSDWAAGLGIPLMSQRPQAEYLYFVGCAGAFDDRNKKTTVAFARLLQRANVDFAILGTEELCNGETARRLGNEYLYQTMAQALIEVFSKYGVKKIITNCPHCFNTFKNEYPQFGGYYEVVPAAELIERLFAEGRLAIDEQGQPRRVAYHDSCYYGRYNDIYDSPRALIGKLPGSELREMSRSRRGAMCCGSGGGWMWMEENPKQRVNLLRIDQAMETDPEVIAVSCPFCMIMLDDALKSRNLEEKVRMADVVELVEEATRRKGG